MNDETMWAADRVVALTPGSAITIPEIANDFAIKEAFNSATGGIFLYKTPNQAYQLLEEKVLLKLDWAKNQKPKPSLKKTVAFADEGSSNSDIDKVIARMDAMIMKMDAQYKGMQSRSNHSIPEYDEDDKPIFADKQSARPSGSLPSNTQPNLEGSSSKPYQPPQAGNEHINDVFTRSGKSYDPPINPNDQQNDFENPINFDSEDEEEESTPQLKSQTPKLIKETPMPRPYKPKIPYPQRLRKEKMEAQYGKFLDMIEPVCPIVNAPVGRLLGAYDLRVATLRELVHAGDKTSGDARSWYMISGDAKS
ncbi:hypothetical protein Tco_0273741 [Tanacetum coccineum]